jgi:two-component system sensor histidine kinase QseC
VSLQRRLMLYLLICAPLVWTIALLVSVDRARREVNELFDVELIRLARQVNATLPAAPLAAPGAAGSPRMVETDPGEGDLHDLAIAVWDPQGRLLITDREGAQLEHRPSAAGFVNESIAGESWRVYYLQSPDGGHLVAAGQKEYERDELVFSLTASQLVPWLLVLPVLLLLMAWAVRRALVPVHALAADLQRRSADNLAPVADGQAPTELKPLVGAMNGLFSRVEELLARERRFTADAAHELRTPLAALRAQWDVVRRAADATERQQSEAKFEAGLQRMDRLVTQMLALSRAESAPRSLLTLEVAWPAIVEQAISDCLALAQRRGIELACEWPTDGRPALPLLGDSDLLTVLLRNLMDNAVRYAEPGSTVWLRLGTDQLAVENDSEPLSGEQLAAVGQRFHRPPGQQEIGSGLGLSIVERIAALHGLAFTLANNDSGRGVRALLRFPPPAPAHGSAAL